ncbi:MAG: DUF58 domain-containing protein [Acidimicrobiales bacterium]
MPRPTARGVVVLSAFGLVVLAAGTTGTPQLAPLAVVIGVPLLVGPWIAYRRARRARVVVAFEAHIEPGRVAVGGTSSVRLSVANRSTGRAALPSIGLPPPEWQWRARRTGVDHTARQGRLAPSTPLTLALPHPAPGRTESCAVPVPTGRRGVFELPPLRGWAHDPTGLFGAPGPTTPGVIAVVHPVPVRPRQPIVGLAPAPVGAVAAAGSRSGHGLGELEGIRPYEAGDRLSLLHWPAKARYGTWFVRQFGAEGTTATPVVVDDRAGVHRRSDFERLVSVVLFVVVEASEAGRTMLVVTLSGRSYSFEPNDRGLAQAQLVLAELQPAEVRSSTRLPIPLADAVVLTTQTGADRLVQLPARRAPVGPADGIAGGMGGGIDAGPADGTAGDIGFPIPPSTRVIVV